jgi:hypothetical protein
MELATFVGMGQDVSVAWGPGRGPGFCVREAAD